MIFSFFFFWYLDIHDPQRMNPTDLNGSPLSDVTKLTFAILIEVS